MWLGEYKLGDRLPLNLWVRSSSAPTLPDDPPRAIVSSTSAQVESLLMPVKDQLNETALFFTQVCLDGKYSTGMHLVQYIYQLSSTVTSEIHTFNILGGGDDDGTGIAMEYFSVSPSEYLLVQSDNGNLIRRKNPRLT